MRAAWDSCSSSPWFCSVARSRPGRPRASAATFGAEEISSFTSDITIEPSGTLLVHETIVYDFGTVPHHGIFRDLLAREDYVAKPGYDRVYPLTILSVTGRRERPTSTPRKTSPPATSRTRASRSAIPTGRSPVCTPTTSRTACAACSTGSPTTTSWSGTSTASTGRCSSSRHDGNRARAARRSTASGARPAGTAPRSRARPQSPNGDTATFTAKLLGPYSNMTVTVGLPEGRGAGAEADPRGALQRRARRSRINPTRSASRSAARRAGRRGAGARVLASVVTAAYRGSAVDVRRSRSRDVRGGEGAAVRAHARHRWSSRRPTACARVRSGRSSTSPPIRSTSPRRSSTSRSASTSSSRRCRRGASLACTTGS